MNQQQALWLVRGAIASLTPEEQAAVETAAQQIRDIVKTAPEGAGHMAMNLVFMELAEAL